MKKKCDAKIIIIDGDQQNILSVARRMEISKCDYFVLIYSDNSKDLNEDIIYKSRYVCNRADYVRTEEIFTWLYCNRQEDKQVIFPCSDHAEIIIDTNYVRLKEYYIMPGFSDKLGMIAKPMDKFEQKKWADENGLLMTELWDISVNEIELPQIEARYLLILKPTIFAYGSKEDNRMVDLESVLYDSLKKFQKKGYKKILAQPFFKKKYKDRAYGVLLRRKKYVKGTIRKIREYPNERDSTSFVVFDTSTSAEQSVKRVIEILYRERYRGAYDMEFLDCERGGISKQDKLPA